MESTNPADAAVEPGQVEWVPRKRVFAVLGAAGALVLIAGLTALTYLWRGLTGHDQQPWWAVVVMMLGGYVMFIGLWRWLRAERHGFAMHRRIWARIGGGAGLVVVGLLLPLYVAG